MTDTLLRITHKCGCVLSRLSTDGGFKVTEPCEAHKTNYAKRSDKMLHNREKERKRQEYLAFRQRHKKRK